LALQYRGLADSKVVSFPEFYLSQFLTLDPEPSSTSSRLPGADGSLVNAPGSALFLFLSLTPRFSGVLMALTALFNRFSGFRNAAQSLDGKTAKAVEFPRCPTITPLNEAGVLMRYVFPSKKSLLCPMRRSYCDHGDHR